MKAKTTYVAFILDETGSMEICKTPTITGYNEFVQSLQKRKDRAKIFFSLTKFNAQRVKTASSKSIIEVEKLTKNTYIPNHMTPLYDAVGKTIDTLDKDLKNKKSSEYQVLCVILTDGQENASKEFTQEAVASLVKSRRKQGNWEFVFLGANIDSWAVGRLMGVSRKTTSNFKTSNMGDAYKIAMGASESYLDSGKVDLSSSNNEDDL